ncbi:hypothetical protein MKJ01_12605 [Chryseobacterium sp. SSA4.19]|uniref:hypothetical protein n=1 Tax=Chryseobacterium sp. SSA4.19 TaxID=2919915 RepID=UPI001F4E29D2|nr:hypothetical protein [Chryseobacterium sp. SSA4.19]MCJ8154604.1 hypothetical protein [Chryseobacterium sp. SSA4.19]
MRRKTLLILLYLCALAFSVLKTLRFPNDWSEAHWMLDYRFGFIKRGLAGEIFGWFFKKNEFNILLLSGGILFLLYTLIFGIAVRETLKRENSVYGIMFFVTFFLSQYIIFSAHLIGYLDHVVFLMTILSIFMIKQKKIFWASVIAAISIFIHEISFFLLLPVSCFALIMNNVENFSKKPVLSVYIIKKLALFLLLPVVAVFSISAYQEISGESYFLTLFNYLKEISFITDKTADSVSSAYTKSFSYYFKEESGHFIQRLLISKATFLYGIPLVFSLWMIFKEFGLKNNIRVFLLLAVIALIPLLLHAVAYDTYRIWSFPFMILFLGFWILSSVSAPRDQEGYKNASTRETVFFMVSFLLITLVPNVLFDGQTERFTIMTRLIMIMPVLMMLYFLKKAPILKG